MTYIGIDGGGTTTRVLVQHNDEPPDYFERPVSLKVRNRDFEASAEKLKEVLSSLPTMAECLVLSKYPNSALCTQRFALAIGLSGMSRDEDQELLKSAISSLPEFASAKLHIESDATLTLKAVLPEGNEGILLIAGTGSVILYQPGGKAPRRIGGWGPLLSDDGSGYRIGLRTLRRYFLMLDGVYPPDPLTERLRARLIEQGVKDSNDRGEVTKLAETDRTFVASLAKDAFESASGNGGAAQHIKDMLHEELIELFTQIFPIFFKGVMSGNPPYKLYLSGSIAKHPVTLAALEKSFEDTDLTPILVDDSAATMKALEIARGLK